MKNSHACYCAWLFLLVGVVGAIGVVGVIGKVLPLMRQRIYMGVVHRREITGCADFIKGNIIK